MFKQLLFWKNYVNRKITILKRISNDAVINCLTLKIVDEDGQLIVNLKVYYYDIRQKM